MPSAASLRLICCTSQKLKLRQHLGGVSRILRPQSVFHRLNFLRAGCTTQCRQPLQDSPSVENVSFIEVLHTFRLCEEVLTADSTPVRGNEAPSQQDLRTELSWLFEDAIEGACTKEGLDPVAAAQLRSSADLKHFEGRDFSVRIPLQDLLRLWQRRIQERCPLQYLVGAAHWRDFVLAVGPGVLIPRPETENIIDFCQDAIRSHPELASACWVDLGTGSVEYARLNAQRLGVSDLVDVRQGSWCEPCSNLLGSVSGLVSNPPYIPAEDMPNLQFEVQWHEPHEALSDGGADGMASLSRVLECATLLLRPGGFFAFETNGELQARKLQHTASQMTDRNGNRVFEMVEVRSDYYGCHRFCTGFKAQAEL